MYIFEIYIIMDEVIKNRNRIVTILDNCAKVLSTRKDGGEDISKVVLRIRQLANLLRNAILYEKTVKLLYEHFPLLVDVLNVIKDKSLALDNQVIAKLEEVVNEGLKWYKDETLDNVVGGYSIELLNEKIKGTEKQLQETLSYIQKLQDEGKKDTVEYVRSERKVTALKSNVEELKNMVEAKEERADKTEVLNEKVKSITTGIDEAIADLVDEKERLENIYKSYLWGCRIVFGALIVWESFLIFTLYPQLSFNNWKNYIPLYLPLPLLGGLLWVCIYQMNKAQRQMVKLASMLQRHRYKDSLLRASVNLYADMRKNEEHVASLIDDVMKHQEDDAENIEKEDDKPILSLPFDKIVELAKAFTQK